MKILSPRALRALEQFNAAYPWDHNAHYHRWILRQLPRRFNRALDIGSGSVVIRQTVSRSASTPRSVTSYSTTRTIRARA
ncbi:SAM-dependent methyltransferase, partial [Streptomyces sp. NPDC005195]